MFNQSLLLKNNQYLSERVYTVESTCDICNRCWIGSIRLKCKQTYNGYIYLAQQFCYEKNLRKLLPLRHIPCYVTHHITQGRELT